jgi:hypothetical protein
MRRAYDASRQPVSGLNRCSPDPYRVPPDDAVLREALAADINETAQQRFLDQLSSPMSCNPGKRRSTVESTQFQYESDLLWRNEGFVYCLSQILLH